MKRVALAQAKDDLSKYVRLAAKENILVTKHGKPAALIIGFASEEDWFDYQLENDPRFLQRVETARANLRKGMGVRLENIQAD